ncbi:MAG TPA: hypothetical protein PK819_07850 [Thermomicrobiales bacterium]|nr:hypothetical protein [Thermomicrobiales bacterium]
MRRTWRSLVAAIAILAVGGTASATALFPATPQAAECQIAPLQPDELMATVAAGASAPVPLLATKRSVSEDELAAVTAVVVQSLACTNANQPLRALAVFTDRYLAAHFAGDHGSDELGHLIAAASRTPTVASPADEVALISVTNPIAYNDGRIGITVTTANADDTFVDELILAQTEDGWQIDQVISHDPQPDATPTASPTGQAGNRARTFVG